MDEKVIIKSKRANIRLISMLIAGFGILVFLAIYLWNYPDGYTSKPFEIIPLYLSFTFLPFAIAAVIFFAAASTVELTVTDKRVYGKKFFGKRVDLPLDMISAVGTGFIKRIAVTTSSGAINFHLIDNRDEIHDAISRLLIDRQNRAKTAFCVQPIQEASQSAADDIRKYKELLDMGAITQEEFDAKKKQLLGL